MERIDSQNSEEKVIESEDQDLALSDRRHGIVILLLALLAATPPVFRTTGAGGLAVLYTAQCVVWIFASRLQLPLKWILVAATAARLAFAGAEPMLSTDVYRYLWDGRVSASGISPYRYAPLDPELAPLRAEWHSKINHPEIPTIYPPAAQLLFRAASGGGLTGWRAVVLLCDLTSIWLIARLLGRRAALAFALCPLIVLEGAWSGHLEAVVTLAMVLAWRFSMRGRPLLSGLLLAIGTGLKVVPVVTVPSFLRQRRWLVSAGFVAGLLLPLAPFLSTGVMPGFRDYALRWSFNSPLYRVLHWMIRWTSASDRLKDTWTWIKDPLHLERISVFVYAHLYDDFLTRVVLLALLVAALVALQKSRGELPLRVLRAWGLLLLCSPTIHPWYWLPAVPFALAAGNRGERNVWLTLALCSPFSYLFYGGTSEVAVMLLCYAPATFLIARAVIRRRLTTAPA